MIIGFRILAVTGYLEKDYDYGTQAKLWTGCRVKSGVG